ncbi:hypothetical protein CXF61_04725 [Psychrobacter sp. 4Dc]|nr:hypothetical protein CXF61_04725 [Psychrobacter sp. 4Dc]
MTVVTQILTITRIAVRLICTSLPRVGWHWSSSVVSSFIVSELLNRYGVTLPRGTICTIYGRLPCSCFRFL